MSRPQNFLEADSSYREQNLRFVRNNLEDNINQFFGAGGGGGGTSGGQSNVAPQRNFKIVKPNPEFEQRRDFFQQLGLSNSDAVSLSNRSFCSEQFNINYFRDKRNQLRKGLLRPTEADAKIANEINVTVVELERQARNFGGGGGVGFNDRRDGGNIGGGLNGVFNGPRGSDGTGGGGNPDNFNRIGGAVSGRFVGSGAGNFDGRISGGNLGGRGVGLSENSDARAGGFQGTLNNSRIDILGLLGRRVSNINKTLGNRSLDGPGNLDDRRGNAGNFDGRSAAPGIWDDKKGGGQQNLDRNFIGKLDSGPGNFNNRGDGPGNFNNRGDGPGNFSISGDGPGNFNNRGDGPGNFNNRGDGPGNFNNRGDGPGNFNNRGDGPGNFINRGDGPGNFNNRGDGPGNFNNRGDGPGNFINRGDGPGNFNNRGDGPGNFNNSGDGPGNFNNRGDGPGNFNNRGDGPGNFINRGDGPGNFNNRGDGPGNFNDRGDGPGNFNNRGDGPGNFNNMGDSSPGNFGNRGNSGPVNFGNMGNSGSGNFGNLGGGGSGNFGNRADGGSGNFGNRGNDGSGPFVGGPRGFDSNDGGGPRGFDVREGTGPNSFDNRYNGNNTIGNQGRLNEVAVRRSDGREGFEAGGSGFNKQCEEIFTRRAPTPPRNINWNERKRPFPGDVNDGPPSSVRIESSQLNSDDFNRRRNPQSNMNQRNFDQFGGGNKNSTQAPNNNRAPKNISNSKVQNSDRDHGRVGNIGKQNMPVTAGGLIYATNTNRNQNINKANVQPRSGGNNASVGRGSVGGNKPNATATNSSSRNKVNENAPNKSGAQDNKKVAVASNNKTMNKDADKTIGIIGRSNISSQSVNVGRKGDSDGTSSKRNIQNQPNDSNMNSQRKNVSQKSNVANSSQSIGNKEQRGRGSSKPSPSNNIPSLMSKSTMFGYGNRGGPNDNFNNSNQNYGGGQQGNNNYEPMNNDGFQSNPGDIDFVSLLTTLASTTNLTDTFNDNAGNLEGMSTLRVRRRRRGPRRSREKIEHKKVNPTSVQLPNLVTRKDIDWPFKIQKRSLKKLDPLPQTLKESFAVHFFTKRLPIKAGKNEAKPATECDSIWLDDKSDIDSDSDDGGDEDITYNIRIPMRLKTTKKDWRRFDKSEDKDQVWLKWWQEHKPYEMEIRNKLEEFKGQPIKGAISYTPPKNCANPRWQIQNKCNLALRFLKGRGGDSYHIAKYYYLLKDQQFWNSLNEEQMSNVLMAIQRIKNSSWIDFQRGLVLTWVYYNDMINFEKKTDGALTTTHKKICKRAKVFFQNGIFHWMVKEAHFDLKRISASQWTAYDNVYQTL